MIRYLCFFVLQVAALVCQAQPGAPYTVLNLDSIYRIQGSFVLYDYHKDHYSIYNSEKANTEYPVHSTSKITWSVIALEEGLVSEGEEVMNWDSISYPRQDWWPGGWAQGNTIVTALNKSVNWYYIELLSAMTPEMIEKYLDKLDYKRGFNVERIHYFGLTYAIKKSAISQVDFLKRLYTNETGITEKTLKILKQGLLNRQTEGYTLYTKTGLGPADEEQGIGWYIGFIEKGDDLYFFALNVLDRDELAASQLRIDYGMRVLRALGILTPGQ